MSNVEFYELADPSTVLNSAGCLVLVRATGHMNPLSSCQTPSKTQKHTHTDKKTRPFVCLCCRWSLTLRRQKIRPSRLLSAWTSVYWCWYLLRGGGLNGTPTMLTMLIKGAIVTIVGCLAWQMRLGSVLWLCDIVHERSSSRLRFSLLSLFCHKNGNNKMWYKTLWQVTRWVTSSQLTRPIFLVISGAGTNLKVEGTGKAPEKFFLVVPLHFFGSKSTISRFGERFRDG